MNPSLLLLIVSVGASSVPSFCPSTPSPIPAPSSLPISAPTEERTFTCGPDNYVSGNGGGGSCGICVENCGNEADKVLSFFGLSGSTSDVESISNNNGAISYCKDIDSSLVCCGPKYTNGGGGVFVKNSQWYADPTHGENGNQPDVASADSGVCSYGVEGDSSSWITCSGDDAETCEGGDYAERRLTFSFDFEDELSNLDVFDFTENMNVESVVLIACHADLTLNGNGFEINGQGQTGIFHLSHASVNMNDLTITNGASEYGAGIYIDGITTLTMTGVTLSFNEATFDGGAIYHLGDGFLTLHMYNSFVTSNSAVQGSGGGGYITETAVINIDNTAFSENTCHQNGGGLCVAGNGTKAITSISNTFKNNNAGVNGGGLYITDDGTGTIIYSDSSSTIVGNEASGVGGGFYIGGTSTITVSRADVTASHNTAGGTEGTSSHIYFDGGDTSLDECDESSNSAGPNGFIQATTVASTDCKVSTDYYKGSRTCFSSEDTLTTEAGETVLFKDVKIGDRILTANRDGEISYSSIVFLPHGENHVRTKFVEIKTKSGKVIKMTRRHLVPTCSGDLVVAHYVEEGYCLRTVDGDEVVATTSEVHVDGVYTAVAEQEFLVVNGIIASPFASPDAVAHAIYNQTDVEAWCSSNNWLAYESANHHELIEAGEKNPKDPSKDCEVLLSGMFENFKDEPVGWGVQGWGYKGWKNPSSRAKHSEHSDASNKEDPLNLF